MIGTQPRNPQRRIPPTVRCNAEGTHCAFLFYGIGAPIPVFSALWFLLFFALARQRVFLHFPNFHLDAKTKIVPRKTSGWLTRPVTPLAGRSTFAGQGLRHAAKKLSPFVPSFMAFARLLNCDAIAVLGLVNVSRLEVSPPRIHQQRGTALARSENPEVEKVASVPPGRCLHAAQLLTCGFAYWG